MSKCLIVLSGGTDSATLMYKAMNEFDTLEAISFYYGSKHNAREIEMASKLCEINEIKHTIIDLQFINDYFKSDLLLSGGEIPEGHYADENMKSTVVPFRNGIMLSIAAGLAESIDADAIGIGNHAGDHTIYPDCRPEFIFALTEAIRNGTYKKVTVWSPFSNITKSDIISIGLKLGVPYSFTYSCYKGNDKHCGKCGTCVERLESFADNNVKDQVQYEED